jgi:hypothetical protein
VTFWGELFLGVIALSTLTTAVVQVGVLIAAGRAARRVERLMDRLEDQLQPTLGHLNLISREASRAVTLAASHVDRADRLLTDLSQRAEKTMGLLQESIVAPARNGKALLFAFQTAFDVLSAARRRSARRRADDDDALFI